MGDELFAKLKRDIKQLHMSLPVSNAGHVSTNANNNTVSNDDNDSNGGDVRIQTTNRKDRKDNDDVSKNTGSITEKPDNVSIKLDDIKSEPDKKDIKKKNKKKYILDKEIKEEDLDKLILEKENRKKENKEAREYMKKKKEKQNIKNENKIENENKVEEKKDVTKSKPDKEIIKPDIKPDIKHDIKPKHDETKKEEKTENENRVEEKTNLTLSCKKCGKQLSNVETYFSRANIPYIKSNCDNCNTNSSRKKLVKELTEEEYKKFKNRNRNTQTQEISGDVIDIIKKRLNEKK